MFNPIKWLKQKLEERKRKKKLEEKLKKLQEQDPFIYD